MSAFNEMGIKCNSWKEMNQLEKMGIITKGHTGYGSPVLLVKWKIQNPFWLCKISMYSMIHWSKINCTFLFVKDCIWVKGHSN